MIAGKKRPAAKKAPLTKRIGVRVINRCSPLVLLWANPRLRLPPESRLRHSLIKHTECGKVPQFVAQKTGHLSRERITRLLGVSNNRTRQKSASNVSEAVKKIDAARPSKLPRKF